MKSLLSFLLLFIGCTTFSDSEISEPSTTVGGGEGGSSGSNNHLSCGLGTVEREGECVVAGGFGGSSGNSGAGQGGTTTAGAGGDAGSGGAGAGGNAAGAGGDAGSGGAGAGGEAGGIAGAGSIVGTGGATTGGSGGSTTAGSGGNTTAGAGGNTTAGAGGTGTGGECKEGETFCDGICINAQTNKNNCGACGKVCAGTCSKGKCTVSFYSSEPVSCKISSLPTPEPELGAKFITSVPGKVTAIRFFSDSAMGKVFHVNLWNATSQKNLATATVKFFLKTGWVKVSLPTPVPLAEDTVYIVSLQTMSGKFCHSGVVPAEKKVGPLTFLSDNSYRNNNGGFPATKDPTEFFVDIVFTED